MELADCALSFCSCFFATAGAKLLPDDVTSELWTVLVSAVAMQPFDIVDAGSVWSHPTQYESLRARVGADVHIYQSLDVEHELPYLISQSAVIAFDSVTDQQTNPLTATPFEASLLYTGVPEHDRPKRHWPGVYVEPFASSSEVKSLVAKEAKTTAQVLPRRSVFNSGGLAEWASQTSAIVAAWQVRPSLDQIAESSQCSLDAAKKLAPRNWFWNPDVSSGAAGDGVPDSYEMPVGDAGVYDDLGHLPLLRRRVSKMVIFDSSPIPPDTKNLTGAHKVTLEANVYLKAAFGALGGLEPPNPPGSPNPVSAEQYLTVFEPESLSLYGAR